MIAHLMLLPVIAALTSFGCPLGSARGQQAPLPGLPTAGQDPPPTQQPQPTQFPRQPQVSEPVLRDPLDPVWMQPPGGQPFQGFPVFPSRLLGYGNYPAAGGKGTPLRSLLPLLAPAAPEQPGWPTWIRTRNKQPLPYAPDVGLLIRHSDRVWYEEADDTVFVPLFPHDKFRALTAGAAVEVRHQGAFELLLHDSTRLLASGPTQLRLAELGADAVRVEIKALTRFAITVGRRAHTFVLPDGSELRLAAPTAEEDKQGAIAVLLERADEPGWFGGRATLSNQGRRPVLWHHATGEVLLGPDERVTLFLSTPQRPIGMELQAEGVTMQAAKGDCQGRAATAGSVRWCGAGIALPAGATLRLESLQGDAFVPAVPAAAKSGS